MEVVGALVLVGIAFTVVCFYEKEPNYGIGSAVLTLILASIFLYWLVIVEPDVEYYEVRTGYIDDQVIQLYVDRDGKTKALEDPVYNPEKNVYIRYTYPKNMSLERDVETKAVIK